MPILYLQNNKYKIFNILHFYRFTGAYFNSFFNFKITNDIDDISEIENKFYIPGNLLIFMMMM